MTIGKLHDVVEDTDWTLQDLRDVGFSARAIEGIDGPLPEGALGKRLVMPGPRA